MPSSYILINKPPGYSSYFITGALPEEVVTDLEKALSYTPKNADFAQAAVVEKHAKENIQREKDGLSTIDFPPWDGKVHFLRLTKNKKKLYFPIGLKKRVIDILSVYDIGVKVKDEYANEEKEVMYSWNGPKLRDYQIEAAKALISNQGGAIVVPTGGGKSLIGMKIIYAMKKRTLILVHKHELFKQWCENIEKIFGLEGVSYGDGITVFPPGDITIATVQTLHSGLRNKNPMALTVLESQPYVLVMDEIHHYSSKTFYEVGTKIDARVKIGMTATPNRPDGEDMRFEAVVGPIVYTMTTTPLFEAGHLTIPVFEFITVPYGGAGRTYAQIYSSGIVHNEERNRLICERARQLVEEGRQIYIHVERIVHGEILSKMLNAPFVSSKSKERDETIETFKNGYTNILISTLLSEGVDIPSISAIVLASGGKSEISVIQRIGRALRPDPKFKTAVICDVGDKGKYLSEHALSRYNTYVAVYGEDIVLRRK